MFSELEFTTLLKELAPSVDNSVITYELKPTALQIEHLLEAARALNSVTGKAQGLSIAISADATAISEEVAASDDAADAEAALAEAEPPPAETMSLFGVPEVAPVVTPETTVAELVVDPACRLGLAAAEDAALEVSLDMPGVMEALADATLPKDLHDLKSRASGACSAWDGTAWGSR